MGQGARWSGRSRICKRTYDAHLGSRHGNIADDPALPSCNIVEGLAFALDSFWAVCPLWTGVGQMYRSEDGFNWSLASDIGQTEGHLFLSFHDGAFAAYGDSGTSFSSTDGVAWSEMSGITNATWCDNAWHTESDCGNASWFDGAWYRTQWPDVIERSTDSISWTQVYKDPEQNSLYRPRAIAEGRLR